MSTNNAETKEAAPVSGEPPRKANTRAQKPRVAPAKGKAGKKATPAKKGHKAPKAAKQAKPAGSAREGSKTSKVLDLLKRSDGATLKELMKPFRRLRFVFVVDVSFQLSPRRNQSDEQVTEQRNAGFCHQ